MNVEELWICFLVIFISLSNGTQTGSRTAVIIKEDALVDKVTRLNHNLKLVKLKKVKKIYTNLPDEQTSQSSKKRTIIDLNTKHNLVTQTPISFLDATGDAFNERIDSNLQDVKPSNTRSTESMLLHKAPVDLRSPVDLKDLKEEPKATRPDKQPIAKQSDLKDKKLSKSSLLNSRLSKGLIHHNEIVNDKLTDSASESDQKRKPSKVLFPSANKFKNSLNHLSRPLATNPIYSSLTFNKFTTTTVKPRQDFLHKTTRKPIQTTTLKPTSQTTRKPIKGNFKSDRLKSFTTTTTESPRTFTYRPSKRTTTYKPYVYSPVTTTTTGPILRIRKSFPSTTLRQVKAVSNKPSFNEIDVRKNDLRIEHDHKDYHQNGHNSDHKDAYNDGHKDDYKDAYKNGHKGDQKDAYKDAYKDGHKDDHKDAYKDEIRKATTNGLSLEKLRPDLEPNNSNRKYAKLFFDRTTKATEKESETVTTTTPLTTTRLTTTSYLRTNSRVSTFSSYTPLTRHYTTAVPQTRPYESTTERSISNEINKEQILTAVRKRPIYRPRTVKPTQWTTTTVSPRSESFLTTTESPFRSKTTYSPLFRSTTASYSPRFRSTTESSLSEEFKTLTYTTTPMPIMTTTQYYRYSETSFYRQKDHTSSYKETTDSPIRTTESSNDLMSNFIPRRSKWVLKGTRQRKSETTALNALKYTKPMSSRTEATTQPITRRFITTTPKSTETNTNQLDDLNTQQPEYATVERAPKSIESSYQLKRPKPFLIDDDASGREPISKQLKYDEPSREAKNSIEESPDKEIYYQDIKVRKESKLVPQTYIYSTSAPLSVQKMNERLSYLNKEKSKYQDAYQKSPYTEDERKSNYDESYEHRPRYPTNLAYTPVSKPTPHQSSRYENRPRSRPEENAKREYSPPPPVLTTSQPYVRGHFNLGPSLANSVPKYGPIDNVVPKYKPIVQNGPVPDNDAAKYDPKQIVGKLSKAFSNQPPIPYFAPENSKADLIEYKDNYNPPDRYPAMNEQGNYNIDLKRIPANRTPPPPTYQRPVPKYPTTGEPISHPNVHSNEIENRPFDFSNYKPLPNSKFIRTDLENNEIPAFDKPAYKNHKQTDSRPRVDERRPVINTPVINEPNYNSPNYNPPKYTLPVQSNYNQPNYNKPNYNQPTLPPTNSRNPTYFEPNINEINKPPSTGRGWRLSKIPAKVVYDKYNKKFSGRINLKPTNYISTPKHYAEIPPDIHPIQYQPKPQLLSTVGRPPTDYRPPTKPDHYGNNNNVPDYARYTNSPVHKPDYKEVYKPPQIKPSNYKYSDYKDRPEHRPSPQYRPPTNYRQPQTEYNPNYNAIRPSPLLNNQNGHSRNVYPNPYYKGDQPTNDPPVRFYSDRPKTPTYNQPNNNQFNSQFSIEHDSRPPNRPVNGQFNQPSNQNRPDYNQFNNNRLLHNQHQSNRNRLENNRRERPVNSRENSNQRNFEPVHHSRIPFRPIHNHQFNAGHYDDAKAANRVQPYTPDDEIEFINLNDLSLFNGKMPDFKLLQHTKISHDIPVANNYNRYSL